MFLLFLEWRQVFLNLFYRKKCSLLAMSKFAWFHDLFCFINHDSHKFINTWSVLYIQIIVVMVLIINKSTKI